MYTVEDIMRMGYVTRKRAEKILTEDKTTHAAYLKRGYRSDRFRRREEEFYRRNGLDYGRSNFISGSPVYPHIVIKINSIVITRFKFLFVKTKRDSGFKGHCSDVYIYLSGPLRDKKGVITEQSRREILDQSSVWCIESVHRTCVAFADKDYCYIDEQGKQTPSEVYPVAYLKISDKQVLGFKKKK